MDGLQKLVIGVFLLGISVNQVLSDVAVETPVDITIGHLSPYTDYPITLPALEKGIDRFKQENRTPALNIR